MPTADLRALRVISLGAGVDSTTLLMLANHGELPGGTVDAAIFAGVTWIEVGTGAGFAYVMFGGDEEYRAEADDVAEAAGAELVLLALLRALEALEAART